MNLVGDQNVLGARWEKCQRRDELQRWRKTLGRSFYDSAEVIIGDQDGSRLSSIWGHNALGPTIWHYGESWGVHTHCAARELGDLVLDALSVRCTRPEHTWEPDDPYYQFEDVRRAQIGEIRLMVRACQTSIYNGRKTSGVSSGELSIHEERELCWGWWLDIPRQDGRGLLWVMKSWCSMREVGVAMSYAERIATALTEAGFGSEEILRTRKLWAWRSSDA